MTGSLTNPAVTLGPKLAGLDATFAAFAKMRAAEPAWLARLRRDAFARFSTLGIPTRSEEEWKYTSLRGLDEAPWAHAHSGAAVLAGLGVSTLDAAKSAAASGVAAGDARAAALFSAATLESLLQADEHTIVFDDGLLSTAWSKLGALPEGVRVTPLTDAVATRVEVLEPRFAAALAGSRAFEALNMAFLDAGLLIEIDRKVKLEKPLHIVHIAATGGVARFPRVVVRLGELAEATVLETHVSAPGARTLVCGVTELDLAAGAHLTHAKIQQDSEHGFHVASTRAQLSRDAKLTTYALTHGGKVTRNDLDVALNGEGAEVVLDGFYLVNGKRHVDNHTTVDHRVPHTVSSQLYKGILEDQSRAVFNGKVFVRQDAQKTAAHQLNKNLLLSSECEIDTKPQLEIDADDVKCAHGAAVGPLDQDQIFYLQSRAIPRDVAVRILALGFADEVLLRFPMPFHRERFRKLLPK